MDNQRKREEKETHSLLRVQTAPNGDTIVSGEDMEVSVYHVGEDGTIESSASLRLPPGSTAVVSETAEGISRISVRCPETPEEVFVSVQGISPAVSFRQEQPSVGSLTQKESSGRSRYRWAV